MAKMLITSASSIEGYEIEEYLGVVCGQTVSGSNFFEGIAANMSDVSEQDLAKLETLNKQALDKLEKAAKKNKANAIIGVRLNYNVLASNSMSAIASGTAVRIKKKEVISNKLHKELWVTNYYKRLVPRPVKLIIGGTKDNVQLSCWFYNYNQDDILAIRADIELSNLYEEKLVIKGVDFTFDKNNVTLIESEFVDCKLPANDVMLLRDAKVIINKYVTPRGVFACNDNIVNVSMPLHRLESLKEKRGIDAVEKYRTDGMIWTCNCGYVNEAGAEECIICGRKQEDMKTTSTFDYEEMIAKMQEKEYVIEIKDVLMDYIKDIDSKYRLELLEIMESGLQYEKTRGNMKDTVIEKVEKVFE